MPNFYTYEGLYDTNNSLSYPINSASGTTTINYTCTTTYLFLKILEIGSNFLQFEVTLPNNVSIVLHTIQATINLNTSGNLSPYENKSGYNHTESVNIGYGSTNTDLGTATQNYFIPIQLYNTGSGNVTFVFNTSTNNYSCFLPTTRILMADNT